MTEKTTYTVFEYVDRLPFTCSDLDLDSSDFVFIGHEKYIKQPEGNWKRVAYYVVDDD
jgi:hypothetical protein